MKKLLLHVGYPKAASTSLQNGLFLELHKKKLIHFLGRAWESDFYGVKQNKIEYKTWFRHVLDGNDYRTNFLGELSDSAVNLLSEGLFMQHERFSDCIAAPEKLQKYFLSEADQIEVLLVIRKQEDLLPSYYITTYRRQEKKTFSAFLAYHVKDDWSGEGKIFNFHDVVGAYANVFGKSNVHVVLFEDFVRNKDRFSVELGKAINLDACDIKDNLGHTHLNITRKEVNKLVVKKYDHTTIRGLTYDIFSKFNPKLADPLLIRIPAVTEEEKTMICQFFKDSNLELAEEFSLDKKVMQEYGYF